MWCIVRDVAISMAYTYALSMYLKLVCWVVDIGVG